MIKPLYLKNVTSTSNLDKVRHQDVCIPVSPLPSFFPFTSFIAPALVCGAEACCFPLWSWFPNSENTSHAFRNYEWCLPRIILSIWFANGPPPPERGELKKSETPQPFHRSRGTGNARENSEGFRGQPCGDATPYVEANPWEGNPPNRDSGLRAEQADISGGREQTSR